MAALKGQRICVALLQSRKTCLGNYVRPGHISVTMPFEENRRVSGFLHPNVGKTVTIRAFSSSLTGSTDGNKQKGKKNQQQRPTKYHFRDGWQIRPLAWNIPTNTDGGIEHATDLCEIYALVARKSSNFLPS